MENGLIGVTFLLITIKKLVLFVALIVKIHWLMVGVIPANILQACRTQLSNMNDLENQLKLAEECLENIRERLIHSSNVRRDVTVIINDYWNQKEAAIAKAQTSLHGNQISQNKAYEGLGDPATWDEDAKRLQEEMRKKPNQNFDYPEETLGTRIGAEIRAKCNHLTREERDRLLQAGLRRIYGKIDG
jgi:hypothetical protein